MMVAPPLLMMPWLVMVPLLINIIPELIVRVTSELIVRSDTVQMLGSVHVPPIVLHDCSSERVVLVSRYVDITICFGVPTIVLSAFLLGLG